MTPATLNALNLAQTERRPVAFAKRLPDGAELILPNADASPLLNEAAHAVLAVNKNLTKTIAGETWFIEARNPSPRLVIIGAVHIAQALVPLAAITGFDVILADPRTALANQDRFPGVHIMNEWPDIALNMLSPEIGTAIVALTHDPKLDDPALDRALQSDAFYIGALGSRKSHAARLQRLAALGHGAESLARIHGPVGLDIAAITAPEIALSIIAEMVAVRRGGALANRGA